MRLPAPLVRAGTLAALLMTNSLAGSAAACDADCPPASSSATAATAAPAYAAALQEEIRRVLRGPEFARQETVRELGQRDWLRRLTKEEARANAPRRLDDASTLVGLVATVFKYLAIALLVLAGVWLLLHGARWLSPVLRRSPARPASRQVVTEALAAAAEAAPLPPDVAGAAEAALARGEAALALSLLYRGALAALSTRHGIAWPESATEGECLRLARQHRLPAADSALAPLVRAWQATAYAGDTPVDARALVALYRQHFEERTA